MLFKEDGKSRWSGPGKVTGMEGNKVRIIQSGYDRTVPTCRVIPYKDEKYLEEDKSEPESEIVENLEAMSTKQTEPNRLEETICYVL